jgi:hypothetical protein
MKFYIEAAQICGPDGPIKTPSIETEGELRAIVEAAETAKRQIESFVPIEGLTSPHRGSEALAAILGWAQVGQTLEKLGALLHRVFGDWSDPGCRNMQIATLPLGLNASGLQLWLSVDALLAWLKSQSALLPAQRQDLPAAHYSAFANGLDALKGELTTEAEEHSAESCAAFGLGNCRFQVGDAVPIVVDEAVDSVITGLTQWACRHHSRAALLASDAA